MDSSFYFQPILSNKKKPIMSTKMVTNCVDNWKNSQRLGLVKINTY